MAHLQSYRFMRPNRGTLPIWSSQGLCVMGTKWLCIAVGVRQFQQMYEECISSVVKSLRKGRKGGARDFYIRGDFKNEEEELTNF